MNDSALRSLSETVSQMNSLRSLNVNLLRADTLEFRNQVPLVSVEQANLTEVTLNFWRIKTPELSTYLSRMVENCPPQIKKLDINLSYTSSKDSLLLVLIKQLPQFEQLEEFNMDCYGTQVFQGNS